MAEHGGKHTDTTTCGTAEAHVEQQLIPGIPNEITLDQITSKLSRRDIDNTLLFVSRGWCHAIRSRQVYDARVRSNSTESFVLSNHGPRVYTPPGTRVYGDPNIPKDEMSLWDFTDQCSNLQLPRIPIDCFDTLIPEWGRCATLDGRVYVFGGLDCKVHVLDVAGHRQWKQCANMLSPKQVFGCGVIDGKIYVFGGAVSHESMYGSTAFNPKEDTWSPIRPIVALRGGDPLAILVKREFAVIREPNFYDFYAYHDWQDRHWPLHLSSTDLLEVYDPLKDEWRVVERVGSPKEKLFVAGKKFYSISPLGIDVYDFHRNTWVHRHSFSFAAFVRADPVEVWPLAMLTDDGELLAVLDWPTGDRGTTTSYLMQTRGLRSQENEIVWQKAEFSIPLGENSQGGTLYVISKNAIRI